MKKTWTFETLARASKSTLETIMQEGYAPDIDQLNGYSYCGWNHEPIGKITGEKFRKGFFKKDGTVFGFNQNVLQDHQKYEGNWETIQYKNRPNEFGYFRVSYLKEDDQNNFNAYRHLAVFNYSIPQHKWYLGFFRLIRDIMVLPNKDDHSLILGKAYLQIGRNLNIFCCYFILGYPEKLPVRKESVSCNIIPMPKQIPELSLCSPTSCSGCKKICV